MAVEKITPQLVKKGKGKKRPGYAGWNPGAGSPGTTKSGGNKNTGSTGRERGADRNRNQRTTKSKTTTTGPTNIHTDNPNAPEPYTFIGGKKYTVTPDNKAERNRAELKQQIMNQTKLGGNKIDRFGNTKKSLFRGGGGSGIGSLLSSLFGMAMGIPGLGLLKGGFGRLKEGLGSLNDKIQSTDFARSKTLMDYLDAKKYGGIDARNRKADQTMREARGIQTAMDMRPTTLDPREMARMGLQMPTAPRSKPTFSDPFANTVGTTTKVNTTNDAVSSNSIPTVNGVPMINTGSVYQDNLNFFENLNKGLVVNNEPPMVNTDNVMQGSVLDAKPKKGIMETISDFFFTPAGAAEIDYSKLPGATENFTPKFDFIEKYSDGVKDYTGTTKQDYVDAVTSGAFGNIAGATSWDRNVGDLFEGVDLNKSGSLFSTTPTFVSHGQGTGSGYIDVDEDSLQDSALKALPEGFFKAKGGRVGYANGGLASLFTRNGGLV